MKNTGVDMWYSRDRKVVYRSKVELPQLNNSRHCVAQQHLLEPHGDRSALQCWSVSLDSSCSSSLDLDLLGFLCRPPFAWC